MIVEKFSPDFLWFKISRQYTNNAKDIFVCGIYISPCKMQSHPFDYFITETKIRAAVKKLKNNKLPYSDKIRNEMIKTSLNEMMPVYQKLFNNIFDLGSMPLMWCGGLITPIFKWKK